jgi:hypothetical protein
MVSGVPTGVRYGEPAVGETLTVRQKIIKEQGSRHLLIYMQGSIGLRFIPAWVK